MAKTATRTKFQSPEPLSSRPREPSTARRREASGAGGRSRPSLRPPDRITGAILFFALVGLGIAIYTTVVHYVGSGALLCGANGATSSCAQVQFSQYNNVAGIPVSDLGVVGYLTILASLRVRSDLGRAAGFGVALSGFLFSLYLTYREAFSLHTYCEWCLGSAFCMTMLTVLLAVRYVRADPPALSGAAA
ncbi:MAG TPA: vitamin K epoxide reductase family protein [Solirubrobacteraceae bacterium]|nr:vitamin K epoxide reductase family protein [Solirubrobacteraceae bacterium]